MIKSIKAILAQDKEKFKVPRKVQDLIPIKNIWPDGIFKVGNKFSKSFRFSDINYLVASREDTLKRYAGYDKDSGYYILEYENEARYPGKTIKVRSFQVQGVARHVIKSL